MSLQLDDLAVLNPGWNGDPDIFFVYGQHLLMGGGGIGKTQAQFGMVVLAAECRLLPRADWQKRDSKKSENSPLSSPPSEPAEFCAAPGAAGPEFAECAKRYQRRRPVPADCCAFQMPRHAASPSHTGHTSFASRDR